MYPDKMVTIKAVLNFNGQPRKGINIGRDIDTTYSTISKELHWLHDKGFIKVVNQKNKRCIYYQLTEKGKRLKKIFMDLKEIWNEK